MTFEPQNQLERSLLRAIGDPAYRPQFYRDLSEADLFIVQEGPPPERTSVVLSKGEKIRIQPIEIGGREYLPVFSSLPRLQEVIASEARYLQLSAIEFFKMASGAALWLNPGSECGKEFSPEEIQGLLDGSLWRVADQRVIQQDTQVLLGQPKQYPQALADSLCRFFKTKSEIKRAWLAQMLDPAIDERPSLIVAVEAAGDFGRLASEMGIVIRSAASPGIPVDVIQFTGQGGLDGYFSNNKPLYRKRWLGIF